MIRVFGVLISMMMVLPSLASAFDQSLLETTLRNSALEQGGYGDETVICGGELLSYHVISETPTNVLVDLSMTEQVNYCESETQVDCHVVVSKTTNDYSVTSFRCEP